METGGRLADFATGRPRLISLVLAGLTVAVLLLAALPSVFPNAFGSLHGLRVDTDPENMLSHDEPVRVFHDEMKARFELHDMIVAGIVNEAHPNGVFNPESLRVVYELTEFAKTLQWPDPANPDRMIGVVRRDMLAPSMVDNIEQAGPGTVRFDWLMPEPPETEAEALAIRDRARRLPFLDGTLVSGDGKAIALYLPLTSKDVSFRVARALQAKAAEFDGGDAIYITGLPVAEDTFGVEMFIQMAISAPAAMAVIFLLLLVFFRKLLLIISPMLVAMSSVILTMGLLIITGNTVHIMSSMIPIFIMPIAVLDSVHILSEFFDRYQETRDRRKTMRNVLRTLFTPMLFTSLTSAAGFASLALTPIPPVQVFGVFVALGILFAWAITIIFVPAYVMFIPQGRLEDFGARHTPEEEAHPTLTGRALHWLGEFSHGRMKAILAVSLALVVIAGWGVTRIEINDNPTRWFKSSHPIRVADRVLNEHFGGAYMAYLALRAPEETPSPAEESRAIRERLDAFAGEDAGATPGLAEGAAALRAILDDGDPAPRPVLLERLAARVEDGLDSASDETYLAWDQLRRHVEREAQRDDLFKLPETLAYMTALQERLESLEVVGKSNSLADLVKTVHRELFEGDPEQFRIPDSANAVAQTIITFEGSHRPYDLWHFVTPDFRDASIWLQLRSGDNRDMSRVVEASEAFFASNPPPFGITPEWFGLTYINVVWQEKMVSGMLQAFLGSFLVVLLMMTLLFRSALWGLLSMAPLTLTIGLIYGVIGIVGKDYDMPVAVLSSLTLGLAIDFAIHFLVRSRMLYAEHGSWDRVHTLVFGEPARAIARNIVVLAVGFLPLLAAPLVPYITVGALLAAILLVSGAATLFLLPALIRLLEGALFPKSAAAAFACKCGTCMMSAVFAAGVVAINLHQFLTAGWTALSLMSAVALPPVFLLCWLLSRRTKCGAGMDEDGPGAPKAG